jgi:hypothetical protein
MHLRKKAGCKREEEGSEREKDRRREGGKEGRGRGYLMWMNLAPGKSSRRTRTRAVWEGDCRGKKGGREGGREGGRKGGR